MAAKPKITARCNFTGLFPGSKTKASFSAQIPTSGAVLIAAPLVSSFRSIMAEQWPDPAKRPALKRLVITINFPAS